MIVEVIVATEVEYLTWESASEYRTVVARMSR